MQPRHVWLVVGTRPEAIKLSPVAAALNQRGLAPCIVFTGQHRDLDPAEYGLGGYDRIDLDCPGRTDPDAHAAAVRRALLPQLKRRPSLIAVQGDTSSALGAAQAAFDAGVPVAHVEAGLRTYDASAPWPEEGYRRAIDARAVMLFAPTDRAADNLTAEGVSGSVFVTGNSGIDATLAVEARLPPPAVRDSARPRLLITCHRRESWGDGLAGIAEAIRDLAADGTDLRFVLHPNAHVAATMRPLLDGIAGVTLLEPRGHGAMLQEMRSADLVLSDSGGMQEEAPVLGVPLLVLRAKTERPEGIDDGHALLVGTDPERIVATVRRLLGDPIALAAMSRRGFPYGDGRASARIAARVAEWLEGGRMTG